MSYQITWSEGTKEQLRTGVVFLNAGDRREWLIDRIVEHVEKEIAAYPQDAAHSRGSMSPESFTSPIARSVTRFTWTHTSPRLQE
jgi:hypothetical protein